MKKIMILIVLILTACGASGPTLATEMVSALSARADLYDMEYGGDTEVNVARICLNDPAGLYWNEKYQTWAVVCVMLDSSYQVLSTQNINATSLGSLEDMIGSIGWVRVQQ